MIKCLKLLNRRWSSCLKWKLPEGWRGVGEMDPLSVEYLMKTYLLVLRNAK